MTRRPNVLLIVMDCVRFDYLSVYGYPRPTTPNLQHVAADGVVFENAFATAPWTPPSHASLFTGTYPSHHGVDVNENLHLASEHRTLAEIFSDAGYRTFGVLPDVHLSSIRNFHRGFQDYVELWRIPYWKAESDWLKCLAWNAVHGRDKRTNYTNHKLVEWLGRTVRSRDPFFVFVNYKTAHNRYQPPFEYRRRFGIRPPEADMRRARYYSKIGGYPYMAGALPMTEAELTAVRSWYAGAIAYLDFRLGELFGFLADHGAWDDTLVIVTADHGENLGEHGLGYHLFCLYDTLLHVPLLMSHPRLLPRGRRVPGLVSLTDVVPTVLELLDMDRRGLPLQGRSLVPFDDRVYHDEVFGEFGRPFHMLKRLRNEFAGKDFSRFDRGLQCVRTTDYKLIVGSDGSEELYAVDRDPGETHNLAREMPGVAADLRARLERLRSRPAADAGAGVQPAEEDASVLKALRDLGYF